MKKYSSVFHTYIPLSWKSRSFVVAPTFELPLLSSTALQSLLCLSHVAFLSFCRSMTQSLVNDV